MNNQLIVKPADIIEGLRVEIQPLIDSSGQSWDRHRTALMIAFQQYPKLLECTRDSLYRESMKCAADGLVPDGRQAVLLPYWDKDEKAYIANYQPMVYGVIKRMKELGGVFQVICNLVYEKDAFTYDEANPESISHPFNNFATDRGAVVGGYVIFKDDQGRFMHVEVLPLSELIKARNASKAPGSPAWKTWESEMYRKVILRRGSKYITIDNDRIRELINRVDSMFDFDAPRNAPTERMNPFGAASLPQSQPMAALPAGASVDITPKVDARQPAGDQQHADRQPETRRDQKQQGKGQKASQQPAKQSQEPAQQKTGDQQQTKAQEKQPKPVPDVPDIDIDADNRDLAVDMAEKILSIPNRSDLPFENRRDELKATAAAWKKEAPPALHDLAKVCIEMADWCIQRGFEGNSWIAEHGMFMHKLKDLLQVEKLEIGDYPDA